ILGGYIYEYSPSLPWMIQASIIGVCVILAFILVSEPEKAQM
ncbi:unnamed protein product, partial [marine sediment metagenome]